VLPTPKKDDLPLIFIIDEVPEVPTLSVCEFAIVNPKFALINPEADIVVNTPVDGVEDPIGPGLANVAPLKVDALKLATVVVDETTNGAVPVDTVDVS
jgi:hypothetical protein